MSREKEEQDSVTSPSSKVETMERENDISQRSFFSISRKVRWFIFSIELCCLANFDQGAISASTTEIKNYFKMTDRELGSFGGIGFLGTTLGGIFSLSIINKFNRKYTIMSLLCTNIISLFIPTIITSKILLMFCRILSGFSQSFNSIYLPVWVDQFGIYNKKSIMMSLISLPSALGYLLGYIFAVLTSWKNTFHLCIIINISLFFCFFLSDNLYFSKTLVSKKKNDLNNTNSFNNEFDNISLFEDISGENSTFGNESLISQGKQCFKSKLFRMSNLSLITLLLILSGFQFWINDYLENTVKIIDKKERLLYFLVILLINIIGAPISGGQIMQRIGGYESINGILFPFYSCIISLISSNLLLFTTYKYFVAMLIGIYLFTGCMMIASLNGIIVSSIPKEYTGSASAISNLSYNIIGRLNGPNVYGLLRSFCGKDSRIPMVFLLDIKFITLFCLYKCIKYRKESLS